MIHFINVTLFSLDVMQKRCMTIPWCDRCRKHTQAAGPAHHEMWKSKGLPTPLPNQDSVQRVASYMCQWTFLWTANHLSCPRAPGMADGHQSQAQPHLRPLLLFQCPCTSSQNSQFSSGKQDHRALRLQRLSSHRGHLCTLDTCWDPPSIRLSS